MKQLVEVLCRGLGLAVDPAGIVEERSGEDVTVTLSLPVEDLQKIDGRDHRTAKAVRQVLSAAAAAGKVRFHLVARASS
ncbi:MAG TPA: hypothetical protein VK914_11250 [bacterium]|jgi:predicted RNA-binding protein YlqC (UPF0109 family)|nr:hypothetical protein [bacterium]